MSGNFPHLRDVIPYAIFNAADREGASTTAYGLACLLGLAIVLQSIVTGMVPVVMVMLSVTLIGFSARHRWSDALIFAAAHLTANWCLDESVGPAALGAVTLTLLAITGRPRLALLLGISITLLVVGGGYLMERFASSSLTTQDLRYFSGQFSANREIFATQPTVNVALLGGLGAVAMVAVIGYFLDGRKPALDQPMRRTVSCLFLASCFAIPVTQEASKAGMQPTPNLHETRPHTPLLTFISTLFSEPQARWNRVSVTQFASEVDKLTASDVPAAPAPADIVLFLQESQFNPETVAGCPPSLCRLSAFGASDMTSTDFGPLRVPVHGSGTWLSEFAVLTGLPHSLWGRAGRYAPFNIAPRLKRTFVKSLREAGYHTIGIYPTKGELMNGRAAFHAYGFDEFLDAGALHLAPGFANPDRVIHAAAAEALARGRKLGKPVFVFALTIFNHSEHGIALDRVPQDIKQTLLATIPETDEALSLADYVWRSREFSESFEAISHKILSGDRSALVAWFGDHQPPFALAPGLRKRIQSAHADTGPFTTWYAIHSNGQAKPAPSRPGEMLDLVFLPGLLAERAGVPLDQWLAANILARRKCLGRLAECKDAAAGNEYTTYLLDSLGAVEN